MEMMGNTNEKFLSPNEGILATQNLLKKYI
jgi:hypothetical protein